MPQVNQPVTLDDLAICLTALKVLSATIETAALFIPGLNTETARMEAVQTAAKFERILCAQALEQRRAAAAKGQPKPPATDPKREKFKSGQKTAAVGGA